MRWFGVGLSCVLMAACAHENEVKNEPVQQAAWAAPATQAAKPEAVATGATKIVAACAVDDNCDIKQLCIRSVCTPISDAVAECTAGRVYFDKDSEELGPTDRQNLTRVSRCLKADQRIHVTIAGNTDVSGPREHNRDLGDRRASAVADFLLAQGVSRDQLRTLSFGEEMPVCWTQDEDCMAKNRRVAVKPYPQRRKIDIATIPKNNKPM